jgi:hypothetical protein
MLFQLINLVEDRFHHPLVAELTIAADRKTLRESSPVASGSSSASVQSTKSSQKRNWQTLLQIAVCFPSTAFGSILEKVLLRPP